MFYGWGWCDVTSVILMQDLVDASPFKTFFPTFSFFLSSSLSIYSSSSFFLFFITFGIFFHWSFACLLLLCLFFRPSFGCCQRQSWPRQDLWWMMTEHKSSLIHPASDKPSHGCQMIVKEKTTNMSSTVTPTSLSLSLSLDRIVRQKKSLWVKVSRKPEKKKIVEPLVVCLTLLPHLTSELAMEGTLLNHLDSDHGEWNSISPIATSSML